MIASNDFNNRGEQIRFIAKYDATGMRQELNIERISDVLAEKNGAMIWVGLFEPDETVLYKMQVEFDLHPLAIEDAHKAHQRPKVERFGNCLFIVVQTAQLSGDAISYGETQLFLGKDFIITVRHGGSLSYASARERCEQNPEFQPLNTSMALYSVLDLIVDNFFPIVQEYEKSLDQLEASILSAQYQRDTIIHLYKLRANLTKLRLAVSPLQDILSNLLNYHSDLIQHDVHVYLRDVHDHVIRLNESIDTMRETIGSAMTTNLSLVTVSQGDTMKRLAGWAALLAVPTLITSWFGMNFSYMPEIHWQYSYPSLMVIILGLCIVLYRKLKKVGWL